VTTSKQRGGVILSNNARSGFVKFIHPDGYAFVECDEDSIEDSYVHSSLVEKHELSANDEITYAVSRKKGRESVSEIFSINGSAIKKINSDSENITIRKRSSQDTGLFRWCALWKNAC
jgi:cold shock CspA family protein